MYIVCTCIHNKYMNAYKNFNSKKEKKIRNTDPIAIQNTCLESTIPCLYLKKNTTCWRNSWFPEWSRMYKSHAGSCMLEAVFGTLCYCDKHNDQSASQKKECSSEGGGGVC